MAAISKSSIMVTVVMGPHDGLAGAGGCGHQHPVPGFERPASLLLEVVEREVVPPGKSVELGLCGAR